MKLVILVLIVFGFAGLYLFASGKAGASFDDGSFIWSILALIVGGAALALAAVLAIIQWLN